MSSPGVSPIDRCSRLAMLRPSAPRVKLTARAWPLTPNLTTYEPIPGSTRRVRAILAVRGSGADTRI